MRIMFASCFLAILVAITAAASDVSPRTLNNLQVAFAEETNAHVRYLAFAKRADEEGYGKAASLFRATALSRQIHANNLARAIKKLGAAPQEKVETLAVNSTKDNLGAAIKAETFKSSTQYPDFWMQARADHDGDAMRAFTFALSPETGELFAEAFNNLETMKGAAEPYYVCSVCGHLTKAAVDNCPSCPNSKGAYEEVR